MQSRVLIMFDWWWSHQLNYSVATDVLGRKISLISSAIFGLKHHSPDKTIYVGHGSFASGTQEPPAPPLQKPLFAWAAIIYPPQVCRILQNITRTLLCRASRICTADEWGCIYRNVTYGCKYVCVGPKDSFELKLSCPNYWECQQLKSNFKSIRLTHVS